jgi:glutathione S-transferase
MAELEIIGAGVSNYVRSCRMLCFEKGVAHTNPQARPYSPEVRAIHPYGLIPVMRHGGFELFESKAIMSYIDAVFPGPKFMPAEPEAMALTEQWIAFTNHKIDRHMVRDYVVQYRFADKATGPDMARINGALPDIEKQAKFVDAALAKSGYLVGRTLTMADMNLMPMLYYTRMLAEGKAIIDPLPHLVSYIERLSALPSFQATGKPKTA